MHTGYTLIQPYVFLTLNSLLTNEHLLSSPADLLCYEFSGDVSLKFVASPYTELIIGQRPDGSCRIFCIRTADEPLILKLSGFSYCFGVRFDESLYYRLPGHPFPFPADLLQTISMSDSDIFSGTVSFSERIQRFLSALNKTGKTPACPPAATLIHQSIKNRQRTGCAYRLFLSPYQPHFYGIFRIQPENLLPAVTLSPYSL